MRAFGVRTLQAGRWATVVTATLVFSFWVTAAWAQSDTRLTLERSESTIEIVNLGRASEGARSILDVRGCQPDAPEALTSLFYAPTSAVTATLRQNDGSETVVSAPLVRLVRPPDGEDQEVLEAIDAEVTFGRPPCLDEVVEPAVPEVVLTQGRTRALGSTFRLDAASDVATLLGPIDLLRQPDADGLPVNATSDALEHDLETGRSTLTGDVTALQGDRVSRADRLELNEAAGEAELTGEPAVSTVGEDEVRGRVLRYDLNRNDLVAEGGVTGVFEVRSEGDD